VLGPAKIPASIVIPNVDGSSVRGGLLLIIPEPWLWMSELIRDSLMKRRFRSSPVSSTRSCGLIPIRVERAAPSGESIPRWPFGFKQGQVCLLITCFVELSCTGKRKDTGALRAEHAQITEYRALQLRHDA